LVPSSERNLRMARRSKSGYGQNPTDKWINAEPNSSFR
jgi:hypothetical protein